MEINLEFKNLGAVQKVFAQLSGKQARVAYAAALNDTGRAGRLEMAKDLKASFDRPTRWVSNSPKYRAATETTLSLAILPTIDTRNAPSRGGKVGVDPQYILQAQEFGGRRADKRSESALRRVGILPPGMQTAIPSDPYPGSDDGNGNLRGAFVQQLLSYLQAFGEQGYKGNMTSKRKSVVHKGRGAQWGRRYFVAYGRLRGGARQTRRGDFDQRASNLAPGIWATDGKYEVAPVLMFVRPGLYKPRISMERITRSIDLQAIFEKKLRHRIREAAGV